MPIRPPHRPVRAQLTHTVPQAELLLPRDAVQWGSGDTIGERKVSLVCLPIARSARRRLPSRGSLGPHFPTFIGTLRRYDCPLSLSEASLVARLPDTLPASRVRGVPHGLVTRGEAPRARQGLGSPGPPFRVWDKETGGSPKFPSSPCEDMPRSQTPVVSFALALPHAGLLPSSACKPSAYHDYTHFGAQSRGLPSHYTRLRTAPCGEARGFATDLLARR